MSPRARRIVLTVAAWLTVYALLAIGIIVLMFRVRASVLAPEQRAESQEAWRKWQADVEQQNRAGPVRRAVPRSGEPPAVVLLRDHFAVVTTSAVIFVLLLFSVLAFAIRAVFSPPRVPATPQGD